MGRRAKRSSTWPATAGAALASAAMVLTLLVPLDPAPRSWIVRGLLVALVLGVCGWVVARGRVRPTAGNRLERVAFQAVFFWGLFTGLAYAVPAWGDLNPVRAVVGGAIAGLIFGALLWSLDTWVVERGGTPSRRSPAAGSDEGSGGP